MNSREDRESQGTGLTGLGGPAGPEAPSVAEARRSAEIQRRDYTRSYWKHAIDKASQAFIVRWHMEALYNRHLELYVKLREQQALLDQAHEAKSLSAIEAHSAAMVRGWHAVICWMHGSVPPNRLSTTWNGGIVLRCDFSQGKHFRVATAWGHEDIPPLTDDEEAAYDLVLMPSGDLVQIDICEDTVVKMWPARTLDFVKVV